VEVRKALTTKGLYVVCCTTATRREGAEVQDKGEINGDRSQLKGEGPHCQILSTGQGISVQLPGSVEVDLVERAKAAPELLKRG
jgi:hypothetical protein